MFFRIAAIGTALLLIGVSIVLLVGLARTGHLSIAAYVVFWALVGAIIPALLIWHHNSR